MSSGQWGLADIEGGKRILDIGWGLSDLVDIRGQWGLADIKGVKGIHRY